MTRNLLSLALSPFLLVAASCSAAPGGGRAPESASSAAFRVTEIARFAKPWALAFIPGTPFALVTERAGKLKLWEQGGAVRDVAGVPAVDYGGQGGLGDVVLAPDFATSDVIYLSWVEAGDGDTRGAVVGRARLVLDGAPRLEGLQVIWRQNPKVPGRGHFSHRIAFSPDGKYLFVASGERQKFAPAQDMSVNLGKIVRLNLDGTPAAGNPFANAGPLARIGEATAQIWTLGHRNILGLRFDAQGRLWDLEHGPKGGDELNLIKAGENYGWPLVSNGDHYDGKAIPRHDTRPDLAKPAINWTPVLAPGDFVFYSGAMFPEWRGQAIIAGMGYPGLVRVRIDGERAAEVARHDLGHRIREIEQSTDGAIWVLEDGEDARLLRLSR